jgi:hypothetical protein
MVTNQAIDGFMQVFPILVYTLSDNTNNFLVTGFAIGIFVNIMLFFCVPESIRFYMVNKQDKKAMAIV